MHTLLILKWWFLLITKQTSTGAALEPMMALLLSQVHLEQDVQGRELVKDVRAAPSFKSDANNNRYVRLDSWEGSNGLLTAV